LIKDQKGFASAELLFATIIALVILSGMLTLSSSLMDKSQTGALGEARIWGEKTAEAINTVYIKGNGYSIDLKLQSDVAFTMNVNSNGYITVFVNGRNVSVKMISKKLLNNYTLTSGNKYQILNQNGTIQITQI
jgi:DNA mismatch repair ATPase MutL